MAMPSESANQDRLRPVRTTIQVQPVVMIFDSKPHRTRKKYVQEPRKSSVAASKKTFAFVHISHGGKADEESHRLVKTHVMQDVLRRKSDEYVKAELKSPKRLEPLQDSSTPVPSPQAPPSRLISYPIQTEPYMHRLVHNYASVMLPSAQSKALVSAWFPLVTTDAALFHALLCTSALFGLPNMAVHTKHMLESIRLINDRLPGDGALSDTTITTILFLAKAEYFQGNYVAWNIHMDGVKKMAELRGGIEKLPPLIQQKMNSTSVMDGIQTGAVPCFPILTL